MHRTRRHKSYSDTTKGACYSRTCAVLECGCHMTFKGCPTPLYVYRIGQCNWGVVWRSQPFTFLYLGGGGRKGSGDSSINDLCHSKIVAHQSDCSILVNYIPSRLQNVRCRNDCASYGQPCMDKMNTRKGYYYDAQ